MGAADRSKKAGDVAAHCVQATGDAALSPPHPPTSPRIPGAGARYPDPEPGGASGKAAHSIEDEDRALSFDEIAAKYEKKIFNLILRNINDREEAEDLTQETFLNAFKSFTTFRGDCKIHTWLCQIALNQCKNRFRQRDRRRLAEGPSLDAPGGSPDDPSRPLEIADWDQSPQEVLLRNETYRYVLKAIGSLPDEYRVVIVLCDLQHMSYQQIAQITGLSLEAVKTRIHRGRLMLRRKVEAYLRS